MSTNTPLPQDAVSTVSGLKNTLARFQATLVEKNQDLRTLGTVKALHTFAESLGFKNWNQLSAIMEAKDDDFEPAPEDLDADEPHTLLYVEGPRDAFSGRPLQDSTFGPVVLPTKLDCVQELYSYVSSRIIEIPDHFIECADSIGSGIDILGFTPDDDTPMATPELRACLKSLWAPGREGDMQAVIDWFFEFIADDQVEASYSIEKADENLWKPVLGG